MTTCAVVHTEHGTQDLHQHGVSVKVGNASSFDDTQRTLLPTTARKLMKMTLHQQEMMTVDFTCY